MIAEHHKGPLSNVHANQAGNAGDRASGAHSSLPWRRVGRVFAATVLTGFVLNEIWEIAQMFLYVETAGRSWTSSLGLCTWAAVGDVGIILGIYATGALAAGDLVWGVRGRWNMRRWLPDAGRTRSACPWCPGLARACGRYFK